MADGEPLKDIVLKDKYEEDGVQVICSDKPIEKDSDNKNYQIPAPNTCLLLCDFNHIMTVFTNWDDKDSEGRVIWYKIMADDPTAALKKDVSGANIHCWAWLY